MALKYYKNEETGEEKRSLKKLDAPWTEILTAPEVKFMECVEPDRKISRQKDLTKILRERSRNHARDVDLDQTIHINRANGLDGAVQRNLLNKNGTKRRKVDDI